VSERKIGKPKTERCGDGHRYSGCGMWDFCCEHEPEMAALDKCGKRLATMYKELREFKQPAMFGSIRFYNDKRSLSTNEYANVRAMFYHYERVERLVQQFSRLLWPLLMPLVWVDNQYRYNCGHWSLTAFASAGRVVVRIKDRFGKDEGETVYLAMIGLDGQPGSLELEAVSGPFDMIECALQNLIANADSITLHVAGNSRIPRED
jgi:hypothetical protein